MQTFFPNIPVATPTTFLVNVNTLEALPLLQGATDAAGFMARMDTVLQMYGGKKVRNKQVVLLIAGISGIATGIIVSLNIPFIHQGLFYPASPVEIVVSLCLTFSVSVVFFVGAIVMDGFRCLKYITAAGLDGNIGIFLTEMSYRCAGEQNMDGARIMMPRINLPLAAAF
ncbi:hypothetical protein ECZC06_55220 [Escherichia coli]|nr:hypothetical protein ECZC06_55220 [Escherichia coli]